MKTRSYTFSIGYRIFAIFVLLVFSFGMVFTFSACDNKGKNTDDDKKEEVITVEKALANHRDNFVRLTSELAKLAISSSENADNLTEVSSRLHFADGKVLTSASLLSIVRNANGKDMLLVYSVTFGSDILSSIVSDSISIDSITKDVSLTQTNSIEFVGEDNYYYNDLIKALYEYAYSASYDKSILSIMSPSFDYVDGHFVFVLNTLVDNRVESVEISIPSSSDFLASYREIISSLVGGNAEKNILSTIDLASLSVSNVDFSIDAFKGEGDMINSIEELLDYHSENLDNLMRKYFLVDYDFSSSLYYAIELEYVESSASVESITILTIDRDTQNVDNIILTTRVANLLSPVSLNALAFSDSIVSLVSASVAKSIVSYDDYDRQIYQNVVDKVLNLVGASGALAVSFESEKDNTTRIDILTNDLSTIKVVAKGTTNQDIMTSLNDVDSYTLDKTSLGSDIYTKVVVEYERVEHNFKSISDALVSYRDSITKNLKPLIDYLTIIPNFDKNKIKDVKFDLGENTTISKINMYVKHNYDAKYLDVYIIELSFDDININDLALSQPNFKNINMTRKLASIDKTEQTEEKLELVKLAYQALGKTISENDEIYFEKVSFGTNYTILQFIGIINNEYSYYGLKIPGKNMENWIENINTNNFEVTSSKSFQFSDNTIDVDFSSGI